MTSAAATGLAELARRAVLVPVTTRTEAQLARVRLPAPTEYAIAANGGRILRDGVVDEAWSREMERRLSAGAGFAAARTRAEAFAARFAGRQHDVDELFAFAVLPTPHLPAEAVDAEVRWAARNGWRVSVQGRKIYWVPDGLTKRAAVEEVARRCGAAVVFAAGDSLLDADLFEVAHRGIRPAHGELHDAGFDAPRVSTTRARGALAGEEIVGWFLAQVRSVAGGEPACAAMPATAAEH
jgi:hydroxymethylpyrimidine pyrophosphatase-like HAD family hydrolase